MARFALWLEQSYPESKIDVVSFAAGGTWYATPPHFS